MTSYHTTLPLWENRSENEKIESLRSMVLELSTYLVKQPSALLLQLLEDHPCENEEEAVSVSLIKKTLTKYPSIWFQSCEQGHITGSGLILDREQKKMLLMHHKKLHRWFQMGGHGEGELDPSHIALREAQEESGLTDLQFFPDVGHPTLIDVDAHMIPQGQNRPAHYHFDFRYLLFTASPEKIRCLETEAKDLRWYSFAEVTQLELQPPTLRLIQKAKRLLNG